MPDWAGCRRQLSAAARHRWHRIAKHNGKVLHSSGAPTFAHQGAGSAHGAPRQTGAVRGAPQLGPVTPPQPWTPTHQSKEEEGGQVAVGIDGISLDVHNRLERDPVCSDAQERRRGSRQTELHRHVGVHLVQLQRSRERGGTAAQNLLWLCSLLLPSSFPCQQLMECRDAAPRAQPRCEPPSLGTWGWALWGAASHRACAGQGRGSPGEGRLQRWRCSNGIRCPSGSAGGGRLLPGHCSVALGQDQPLLHLSPCPVPRAAPRGSVEETVVQRSPVSLPAADLTPPPLLTMVSVISKMSAPAVW